MKETTTNPKASSFNFSPEKKGDLLQSLNDREFQAHLLEGVSRTFALTIPQLPKELRYVITNAYLLCRTVDTIEDEPTIDASTKRDFCERFIQVVSGKENAKKFSHALAPLLSDRTIPAEHELIAHLNRVVNITLGFDEEQKKSLERCVRIMAEGMAYYQDLDTSKGLKTLADMDKYCYYVAGVVGEMLTEQFCHYSSEIAKNKEQLMALAVSFGQGLQMTNILKDIWEDQKRSACWLPQDVFTQAGFNLEELDYNRFSPAFEEGLGHLLGIAHAHLRNAFRYVMLIPPREKGIREFCLWAIGMAILTLKKINRHRNFRKGEEVKISRKSVKTTILATHLTVKSNNSLRLLFNLSRSGLPLRNTSL